MQRLLSKGQGARGTAAEAVANAVAYAVDYAVTLAVGYVVAQAVAQTVAGAITEFKITEHIFYLSDFLDCIIRSATGFEFIWIYHNVQRPFRDQWYHG